MISKEITLINKLGLHARSASKLVSCANAFSSEIRIQYKGKDVSAKSIMELLMLAAKFQETLTVSCLGSDEEEALTAIESLINNKFEEEE